MVILAALEFMESTGLHTNARIHSDTFTIGVIIFDNVLRQVGNFFRFAQALRIKWTCPEAIVRGFRQSVKQWCVNQTGNDSIDANTVDGEIPRRWKGDAYNPAFGGAVGNLADL